MNGVKSNKQNLSTIDKLNEMVNNINTEWQFTRLPNALRGLNGFYPFRLEPFFNIKIIKNTKNKLKLSILTPFLVGNQPEVITKLVGWISL